MGFSAAEVILGFCTLLIFYLYWKTRRPKNYPRGPQRLPVIGNLHNLSDEPAKDFMRMREKYGDIIAVDFGPYRAIVLNSITVIREALNENAFSGRPKFQVLLERTGGKERGVIFTDGSNWVEQRRFILKNLRDFGFGKKSMEGLVQEEIKELIESFKQSAASKTPITTQNKFNAAVLNALWSIISGQRYSHSDPILGNLIKQLNSAIQQSKSLSFTLFFPFLRKILPKFLLPGISMEQRRAQNAVTTEFMRDTVKSHKETFQANSPRDFIDVYLEEISKEEKVSSFHAETGEENLIAVMLDLFAAGAETTSTTLSWSFLLLAIHDDAQEKLFKEIKDVVGLSRLPSLSDRPLMPYTEALIMEVMRYAAMVPLAVQHRTTEDVVFREYHIPKDTLVIPNLYCILKDKSVWGDPDNFRPERFLSSDGTKVIRHDSFIPFSCGRRVCLGETLARDELFLFLSSLFQRFDVKPDPNSPRLVIEYFAAPVLIPKPKNLILTERYY